MATTQFNLSVVRLKESISSGACRSIIVGASGHSVEGRDVSVDTIGLWALSRSEDNDCHSRKSDRCRSINQEATSSYIDDLYVAEGKVTAEQVRDHLRCWGLEVKLPKHIGSSSEVRVLGLKVSNDQTGRHDGRVPQVGREPLTWRQVHKVLGEWTGHFPVAGRLRVASGFLQWCMAEEGVKWDEKVSPETMSKLLEVALMIEKHGDPAKGCWLVDPNAPLTVWTDASSIALGVVLECKGDVVEDAAWLRPKKDSAHINRSELDAAIQGINMALRWGK